MEELLSQLKCMSDAVQFKKFKNLYGVIFMGWRFSQWFLQKYILVSSFLDQSANLEKQFHLDLKK